MTRGSTALFFASLMTAAGMWSCRAGVQDTPLSPRPSARVQKQKASAEGEPGVISTLIGRMGEGTFGPRLVLGSGQRLVVWATPRGEGAGLYSLTLPYDGVLGPSIKLSAAPEGLRFLELVRSGTDGALVVAVRRSGSQEVIELLELDANGQVASGPHVVAETPNEISWADGRATSRGATIFWAEVSKGSADLFGLEMSPGAPGRAQRLTRSASAWQLGGSQESLLVTLEGASSTRSVVLRRIDEKAQPVGAALTLARGIRGGLDLDMASSATRTVIAFTEKGAFENRLQRVVLDSALQVTEPLGPVTPPRGDQALVRLLASPRGPDCFAVWEEPSRKPTTGRSLFISRLDAAGRSAIPDAVLQAHESDPLLPAFALSKRGLVTVAEAPRCTLGRRCDDPPVERMLVQSSADFAQISASPLELAQLTRQPASLVWNAQCDERGCWALAAGTGESPAVFVMDLNGPGNLVAPLVQTKSATRPYVLAQEVVREVPELAGLRGQRLGDTALLSWVSYFDANAPEEKATKPAPDGRMAPVRALLQTELLSSSEGAVRVGAENVISYRARSLGGVAITEPHGKASLVAWSALDADEPHLFLTLVDSSGKKLKQKMMKRPGGEVTDIAAVVTSSGYFVTWVDAREPNPEVYAALVDGDLQVVGQEQRITTSAEQPTGLSVTRVDGRLLVTWADARGASRRGFADLWLARVDEKTGEIFGAVKRLAATELHSHSPQLASFGGSAGDATALVGWLEADPASDSAPSSLLLAQVDGDGRMIAPPVEVPLPGRARAFSADCAVDECHIVTTLDVNDRGELWGLSWKGRDNPRLAPLVVLESPAAQTVAPLLLGRHVFYGDRSSDGKNLLKRLDLQF